MELDTKGLIEKIYGTGFNIANWQSVVDSIHSFLPEYPVALFGVDREIGWSSGIVQAGFSTDSIDKHEAYYGALNPLLPWMLKKPAGQILKTEDFQGKNPLDGSEYLHDFLRPLKLGSGVALVTHNDDTRMMVLAYNCDIKERETAEFRIGQLLSQISTHLTRSFSLMRKIAAEKITMQNYKEVLQHVPHAAFIVDHRGELVSCNNKGQDMLNQKHVVRFSEKMITFGSLSTQASFSRALDAMTKRDYTSIKMEGLLQSSEGVLQPSLYPFTSGFEALDRPFHVLVDRQAFALLIINNLTERQKIDLSLTQQLFGLTKAEIKLSQALLDGDNLQSFADKHMISVLTVRNQIKSIFSKTGSSRQGELIALLARVRGS